MQPKIRILRRTIEVRPTANVLIHVDTLPTRCESRTAYAYGTRISRHAYALSLASASPRLWRSLGGREGASVVPGRGGRVLP